MSPYSNVYLTMSSILIVLFCVVTRCFAQTNETPDPQPTQPPNSAAVGMEPYGIRIDFQQTALVGSRFSPAGPMESLTNSTVGRLAVAQASPRWTFSQPLAYSAPLYQFNATGVGSVSSWSTAAASDMPPQNAIGLATVDALAPDAYGKVLEVIGRAQYVNMSLLFLAHRPTTAGSVVQKTPLIKAVATTTSDMSASSTTVSSSSGKNSMTPATSANTNSPTVGEMSPQATSSSAPPPPPPQSPPPSLPPSPPSAINIHPKFPLTPNMGIGPPARGQRFLYPALDPNDTGSIKLFRLAFNESSSFTPTTVIILGQDYGEKLFLLSQKNALENGQQGSSMMERLLEVFFYVYLVNSDGSPHVDDQGATATAAGVVRQWAWAVGGFGLCLLVAAIALSAYQRYRGKQAAITQQERFAIRYIAQQMANTNISTVNTAAADNINNVTTTNTAATVSAGAAANLNNGRNSSDSGGIAIQMGTVSTPASARHGLSIDRSITNRASNYISIPVQASSSTPLLQPPPQSPPIAAASAPLRFRLPQPTANPARFPMTEITAENINSIPALFDESNDDFHPCSICLDEYSVGDFMRILPCGHRFHVECIDVWLSRSVTCPNCKMDVRTEEEIMEYSTRCQQIEAEHRTMIAARGAT